MKRQLLVEVPDPGAAEMIVAALADEGITGEVRRASRNPYQVTAFAEPLRISVAAEDMPRARAALERLELEMADEVDAQAGRSEDHAPAPEAGSPPRRPNMLIAVALALLVPVPVACLYVGWRRAGATLAGLFVALALVVAARGWQHPAAFALVATKLVDFGAALIAAARAARA